MNQYLELDRRVVRCKGCKDGKTVVSQPYESPVFDVDFTVDRTAHYDACRIGPSGKAVMKLTSEFRRRFDHPGVYGITDPLADNIVYVGRSDSISERFQTHLYAHASPGDGPFAKRKNGFIRDIRSAGQKPGLVVLCNENDPSAEGYYIGWLIPLFNKNGHFECFNDANTPVVKRLAAWHGAHGRDAKRYGYKVTPYAEMWLGFRQFMAPY